MLPSLTCMHMDGSGHELVPIRQFARDKEINMVP